MREPALLTAVLTRLEHAEVLDGLTEPIRKALLAVLPRPVEDLLHGVPAGHPVHPVLVQVPVGAWTSAAVLDLLPGTARASRTLVGVGVLSSAAAIVTGWTDWARTRPEQQRVGIVHAAANEVGTVVYAASWLARATGRHGLGRALSFGAFGLLGAAGYLGGHLAYRQAVGANHADAVIHRFPDGWQPVGALDDLPEGRPVRREAAGESLLLLRRADRVDALSNVCTHLGAPLDEGSLEIEDGTACIACPWHDSVFDLATGAVVHGPATSPQPRFETRVLNGRVEVRLPA